MSAGLLFACPCHDRLTDIFRPFRGFDSARVVPKPDRTAVCFAEFHTSYDAFEAMQRLQHYAFDITKAHDARSRLVIEFSKGRRQR